MAPIPPRLTPFDLVFRELAAERFPGLRASLEGSGADPYDLDAFVLDREVAALLRELVPEDGVGAAIQEHLALLHHGFLFWLGGERLFRLSRARAEALLTPGASAAASAAAAPREYYIQFPERLVWAQLADAEPHEPLDGLFVRPFPAGGFFVLGVFGVHPGRAGFTVADVEGYRPDELAREDGSALFAPTLAGGAGAALHSLVGEEEIVELAARTVPLAGQAAGVTTPTDRIVEIA